MPILKTYKAATFCLTLMLQSPYLFATDSCKQLSKNILLYIQ